MEEKAKEQTENAPLIKNDQLEKCDQDLNYKSLFDSFHKPTALIGTYASIFIMLSISFGAAVVILPYTVYQLGWLTWSIVTLLLIAALGCCVELLNRCCKIMIEKIKDDIPSDCYPELAEMAGGKHARNTATFFVYCHGLFATIAWLLLAATIINDAVPIKGLSIYGQVRCWTVICISVSFPIMCLGNFTNLKATAAIAVLTSAISLTGILANTTLIRTRDHYDRDTVNEPKSHANFFTAFGSICFAAAGAGYLYPNMYVFLKSKEKASYSILTTHIMVFSIYAIGGFVPYFTFGAECKPSITTTIEIYLRKRYHVDIKILTVIAQLCMAAHFILISVIGMNPIFQSVEKFFQVAQELSWKRILIRFTIMFAVAIVCVAVPNFQPVLSLVGGVPITFTCILFPIIIYWRLHDIGVAPKIFLASLFIIFLGLLVGNSVFGIMDLIAVIKKASW